MRPIEALGWGKYEQVRATNRELTEATDADLDAALRGSSQALPWVFAAMVGVALLGGLALSVGRRMATHISSPLEGMQRVADRWAAGETAVRALPAGPREVRNVAVALNSFADENARVRELQQRMLAQLTSADQAKSDFLSNVSHELHTPLTSIAGYMELLEEELTPEQFSIMHVVNRNVDRLRALIENLLTLSSAESGLPVESFGEVDLVALASEVCFDVRTIAAGRSISLELRRGSAPVMVAGSAEQLSRATLNVVSNAVKFSPAGGQVAIGVGHDGGRAWVEVSDCGMGIPSEAMSHLGTRFYRADNAVAGEISGTGLGLRIVRSIMDIHGGKLEIESEEGVGTTARLLLPWVSDLVPASGTGEKGESCVRSSYSPTGTRTALTRTSPRAPGGGPGRPTPLTLILLEAQAGWMLLLIRKRLSGSYCFLIARSRATLPPNCAWTTGSSVGSSPEKFR